MTWEELSNSGFVCDVCGQWYPPELSGELSNRSNGEQLICIDCAWGEPRPDNGMHCEPIAGAK